MTPADALKLIKEKEVKFVDLRFTDTRGKSTRSVPGEDVRSLQVRRWARIRRILDRWLEGIQGLRHAVDARGGDGAPRPFTDEVVLNITCDVVRARRWQGLRPRSAHHSRSGTDGVPEVHVGLGDTAYFVRT